MIKSKSFKLVCLLAIALIFASFSTGFAKVTKIRADLGVRLIDAYEGGRLYTAGGMKIVQLNGGFRQMGRQYGMLLKEDINAVYDIIVNRVLGGEKKMSFEDITKLANDPEVAAPDYIREMVAGMAETSGLSYEQANIVRLNLLMLGTMCSAAAAYGDYAIEGRTVFGRNLDLGKGHISLLKPFTVIAIYNPIGTGRNSVAEIGYAGGFYAQTLFNSRGLILEMNNGLMSRLPKEEEKIKSDPLAYRMYDIMFDCSGIEEAVNEIRKIVLNCGMMLNIADGMNAYCCEIAPEGVYVRSGDRPGFLAVSNHFLNPGWTGGIKIGKGKKYGRTLERHANLIKRGDKLKGAWNAAKMMETFDKTIPKGGPTFPKRRSEDIQTLYSCVFTPADLTLYVKDRERTDWITVKLGDLFLPKGR